MAISKRCCKRAGEIKQTKRRETLIENAENARISLKLVTLDDQGAAEGTAGRISPCTSPTARR